MHQHPDSGFDRIAPYYDRLSRLVFGDALRKAQTEFLSAIPPEARVLLIGGGSGWLLEKLLTVQPGAIVTYLEASPNMLRMAEERLKANPALASASVTFRLGNEDALLPAESFNVILTPFLLDLFPDGRLQHLMQRLHAGLSPGGLWLFADFWPVRSPAPIWQRLLLQAMYTFFGSLSGVQATALPDFERHFARLPLQEVKSALFFSGMVQAKVYRKV